MGFLLVLNGVQICFIVMCMTSTSASSSFVAGRDVALVSVFAAFIAVCALLPAFPVGVTGVPITFQTLAIFTTALVLGGVRGGLATLLYVVVGLIGLPVFAGFKGGFGVLGGGSAGYLLGFAPGAFVIGLVAWLVVRRRPAPAVLGVGFMVAVLLGLAVITVAGVLGMVVNLQLPWDKAFAAAVVYLPGDVLKGVLAVLVAVGVHRAFPGLLKA